MSDVIDASSMPYRLEVSSSFLMSGPWASNKKYDHCAGEIERTMSCRGGRGAHLNPVFQPVSQGQTCDCHYPVLPDKTGNQLGGDPVGATWNLLFFQQVLPEFWTHLVVR
jgi:hypothetical protein